MRLKKIEINENSSIQLKKVYYEFHPKELFLSLDDMNLYLKHNGYYAKIGLKRTKYELKEEKYMLEKKAIQLKGYKTRIKLSSIIKEVLFEQTNILDKAHTRLELKDITKPYNIENIELCYGYILTEDVALKMYDLVKKNHGKYSAKSLGIIFKVDPRRLTNVIYKGFKKYNIPPLKAYVAMKGE